MSFLRNRAGAILVGFIGFAIVAFLIGDAVQVGTPFWAASQNVVGKVGGESIEIQDFNAKVEQNTNNFRQQMGGNLNAQMTSYIVENTWNQTVSEILLNKEVKRLGLEVSKNELNDMISGKNPAPQIVQTFGDPKTGKVNPAQLRAFLDNMDSQPANSPMRQQWSDFLVAIKQQRLSEKYLNLVKNSLYVTSLEAKEDYTERNKLADFSYVNLEYASIPDKDIKLTDEDYKDYYNDNKEKFKNAEETRSFDFVVFNASPSKSDSAEIKEKVNKIAADFKTTTNDSLFVSINSDTKAPVAYVTKGQLDPALDSLVFSASVGTVVGPVFSNGSYKIAKVLDVRVGPDSVKASHILINPAAEGGLDKAKAKADSIANLIRKGASFSELAAKFGTDASKDKGGDLGTFGRGAMIPAFENAVFNGNTGDLKVITTQYGVHVIHIDAQKGSSKVARVAVVDKALTSSNKTQQEAYSKATAFLGSIGSASEFDAKAQKAGVQKQTAENVTASQAFVNGLENPREIIRWAFKADEGDVAEQVFELENKYVVAKLTDIREKGILPLEKVKKEIMPLVLNKVKGQKLAEKFDKALSGSSSINQVAQKLNKAATPVQNVVFANPVIPGVGQENKVVGTVFGLQPNKISKPIVGEQGVYVVSVSKFSNPAPLTNVYQQKEQMMQTLDQRSQGDALKVLRDNADIKDYRIRFF
ncbi:SurA N-terminal domain-containing protein [Rubrolithibacter danxiaensis]|uniref:SurA N-terminal domain-containing protein n=1 Tax=Rubrolithibacter danxiaensis TaxID=3390805 RepID=UPI003BF7A484